MRFEIVQISSGNGPAEVREFVSRLAGRIERICGDCGLHVCEVTCEGPENAPLSVELRVSGGASAVLVGEVGTHQLIARSPLRGRSSRKRWFAAVSIHEHFDKPDDIQPLAVKGSELIVTATKAGGKGGQHVNKVSTAVRVQHPASGVSVRVASERSQRQNIRIAIARISEIVAERRDEKRRVQEGERRQTHQQLVRGNAVRTYRLTSADDLELVTPRIAKNGKEEVTP